VAGSADSLGSGEIDVIAEPTVARALEQPQQCCSFGGPRLAPDDHNDPAMRLGLREFQEVVAVAREQQTIVVAGELENGRIDDFRGEHVAQTDNFVVEFLQQVRQIFWYVVVEQEFHR
jgi:hypothetical protein